VAGGVGAGIVGAGALAATGLRPAQPARSVRNTTSEIAIPDGLGMSG
jgi:hypothetical protein